MGALWPLQVDVFIAVSELALFVGLIDRWAPRSRLAAWAVTVTGLAVSVAGNIGHVTGHSPAVRATAAVPPLAAGSALAVSLGVLKRVVDQHHQAAADAAPGTVPPPVPGDAETAATASLRATLAAGNPWSARHLHRCRRLGAFELARCGPRRYRDPDRVRALNLIHVMRPGDIR